MQSFLQRMKSGVVGLVLLAGGWAVTLDGSPRGPGGAAQWLSKPKLLLVLCCPPHSPAIQRSLRCPHLATQCVKGIFSIESSCPWSFGFACTKMYRGEMWEHGNKRAYSRWSIREPLLQVEVFLFLRGEQLCGVWWELTDTGSLTAPSMVGIGHCFQMCVPMHTHTL